jgi:hypothetical protein
VDSFGSIHASVIELSIIDPPQQNQAGHIGDDGRRIKNQQLMGLYEDAPAPSEPCTNPSFSYKLPLSPYENACKN